MAVHDLDILPDEDLAQDWEGREDGRECRRSVHHPVRQGVHLQSVRQVSDSTSVRVRFSISMSNDYDRVAAIDEFLSGVSISIERM